MAGICGWIGSSALNTESTMLAEQMARDLNEYDASEVKTICAAHWCVNVSSLVRECSVYQKDGEFLALFGKPEVLLEGVNNQALEKDSAAVIRDLYLQHGIEFLGYLSGIFSLAYYREKDQRFLLVNDRLGAYPLYYSIHNNNIVFSTTLRSFRNKTFARNEINYQAIYNYLYFHVIPSPDTIYKEVYSLEPASYVESSGGAVRKSRYWKIDYHNEHNSVDFKNLKAEFLGILREAVRKELSQSHAVGCFLSGGTDSSTVAGLLGEVSGKPAKTYSIGFNEKGFDESGYARIAVSHFKTDHKLYYVTPEDVVDFVGKIAQIYGQPFGNSSVVPTYYCAKLAKADGVDKLLGGDGGDELFGGNERYAKQMLFSKYDAVPALIRHYLIEPTLNHIPFGEKILPVRKAKRYIQQASVPMPQRMTSYNYMNVLGTTTVLTEEFLSNTDTGTPLTALKRMYESSNAQSIVNKMQAMDLKITLADNDLVKVTKMCEAAGVDIGYPLLYRELVAFSARLPVKQKVRAGQLRYFFKEALRDFLPEEIITKQKHGFGLPFGKWMVSDAKLRQLSCDALTDLKKRSIVRPEFIDDLIDKKMKEHANYYGGIAWILMILEYWFQSNE